MPPVVGAVTAFATAVSGAAAAVGGAFGIAAPLAGTNLLASTALSSTLGLALKQIAIGGVLTLIQRALIRDKVKSNGVGGRRVAVQFGETNPYSWIAGKTMATNTLLYSGSWGGDGDTPNVYFVNVYCLSPFPARIRRIWVNDQWCTPLWGEPNPNGSGVPIEEYRYKGKDFLWVKFYDGTQTEPDPYLLAKFGSHPTHPYTNDMVGFGMSYMVVTARFSTVMFTGRPDVRAEISAWGHYDWRKDSSAGGLGGQRWSNWQTWAPTENPIVIIDNIRRGIKDPITGEFLWGGQNILPSDFSSSEVFAAANICDQSVDLDGGGDEKQYRAGLEVTFDNEPASVIEELLASCDGLIAQGSGKFNIRCGAPGVPVYSFTDDTVIVTTADTFDPFPGLTDPPNEVSARHPDPDSGYEFRDAPVRKNAEYLGDDKGIRNNVSLNFSAVTSKTQVQRLMLSKLNDGRRFRKHGPLPLPPETHALTPLDTIEWTSERFGYETKSFQIEVMEDAPDGTTLTAMREVDPNDYDWDTNLELPTDPGWTAPPPVQIGTGVFNVIPWIGYDSASQQRRGGIKILFTVFDDMTGLRYKIYETGTDSLVPGNSVMGVDDDQGTVSSSGMKLAGKQALLDSKPALYRVITDIDSGEAIVYDGLIPGETYDVVVLPEPTVRRRWSDRKTVTVPIVGLTLDDFNQSVRDVITAAEDNADYAIELANEAKDQSQATADLVGGLTSDTLQDIQDLVTALGGLDSGDVLELKNIALAGLKKGWAQDPSFSQWTVDPGSHPEKWSYTGLTYLAKTTGFYVTALDVNIPGTSGVTATVSAAASTGNLDGADPQTEYVVCALQLRAYTGTLSGTQVCVQWKNSSGIWVNGGAFGYTSIPGTLGNSAQWNLQVDDNLLQSKQVVWKKPFTTEATDIRVIATLKTPASTDAVDIKVEYLDLRPATESEIKAYLANAYTDAQITSFGVTITDPANGAIAAQINALKAEYNSTVFAGYNASITALANADTAQVGRIETLESSNGGRNLVRNPNFFDGARENTNPAFWAGFGIAGVEVIERGDASHYGYTYQMNGAPSRYMGVFPDTVSAYAVWPIGFGGNNDGAPETYEGENIQMSVWYATFGMFAGDTQTFGIQTRWFDQSGTLIKTIFRSVTITVQSGWKHFKPDYVTSPANAVTFDCNIRRSSNAGGGILFTNVEISKVDTAAFAKAQDALVTATSADNAVAAINQKAEVRFQDFEAMVEASYGAVATADNAASAIVLRSVAGGAASELQLTAWSDKDMTGSAIVMNADNVIAPGSLSAGLITVGDLGYNLVADDQFQAKSGVAWVRNDVGWSQLKEATVSSSRSLGEWRWTKADWGGSQANPFIRSQPFPVWPGRRLSVKWQAVRGSAGNAYFFGRLNYFDKSGSYVDYQNVGVYNTTGGLVDYSGNVTVPANAYQARLYFYVNAELTTTNVVRFFAPEVISNEDASVLITPDGAFMNKLTAWQAWIGEANIIDLTVGTIKIKDGAITNLASGSRTADLTLTTKGTWYTVAAANINKVADQLVFLTTTVQVKQNAIYLTSTSGDPFPVIVQQAVAPSLRILRGSTVIWSNVRTDSTLFDSSSLTGSTTYTLQASTQTSLTQEVQKGIIDSGAIGVQQAKK